MRTWKLICCVGLSPQVRANFIEARYIGLTAMIFGPMMVSWVVAGLTVRTDYQDLATILGHLATTLVAGLNMLVLVRNHREDAGYRDGYKQARKLQYFSIFPSRLGKSDSQSSSEMNKLDQCRGQQFCCQAGWCKVSQTADQSAGLDRITI